MSRATLVNWLLVLAVLVIAVIPLAFIGSETAFGGADGVAVERIEADHPGYEPWFSPLFEPEAETASTLFALQAAIGAGFLGYLFGALNTRRRLGRGTPAPAPPADPA
ncbi:MAG: energy-coupling factor ABC transporter substrate-binding protein [Pseudonocardiales bacterium]|nr:energy-coupling factor ABC transporter substrate-binding protein [Pseudonocardiales bacterium]